MSAMAKPFYSAVLIDPDDEADLGLIDIPEARTDDRSGDKTSGRLASREWEGTRYRPHSHRRPRSRACGGSLLMPTEPKGEKRPADCHRQRCEGIGLDRERY
jgi:hypothetical protein